MERERKGRGERDGERKEERWLTVDGGEEATDEVLVEVAVLTHLIYLLPLGVCHLVSDGLRCHLLTTQLSTPQLENMEDNRTLARQACSE